MDHAGRARIDDDVEAVAEREEGVRRHHGTGQRQARVLRLDGSDAGRVDTAHLASAHAQGHVIAAEDDGVRLDEFRHFPGEHQVGQLLRRRLQLADHAQVADADVFRVRRLHQQTATDALEVHGVDAAAQRDFQHAHVLLARQNLFRFGGERWGDQHFDEQLGDFAGGSAVQFGIKRDDAAKRGGRVRLQGARVRFGRILAQGDATWVRMLDDDAGGALLETAQALHAFPGRISIGDVVVRQFLALQLAVVGQRAIDGDQVAVEGGALVWILTVAHVLHFLKCNIQHLRISAALGVHFRRAQAGQVVGDGAIVLRRVRKDFFRQHEFGVVADRAGRAVGRAQLRQHGVIVGRIADDDHVLVVLGRRTQHGRATDIDVFDRVFQGAIGLGDRALERVQVDHHHVDGRHVVLDQFRHVLREIAARQDTAVHFRVQGLHTAIEHLRETRVIGNFRDGNTVVCQQFGGAAGGQEVDAEGGQGTGEFENAGLVGNGEESLFDHGCG